jgi:hypothetical protein
VAGSGLHDAVPLVHPAVVVTSCRTTELVFVDCDKTVELGGGVPPPAAGVAQPPEGFS